MTRESPGNPFLSEMVRQRMGFHVAADRFEGSFDAKFLPTNLPHQLTLVEEPNRQVLDQTRRVGLLPGVSLLFRTPLDEGCPPGQSCQMEGKILEPSRLGNAQRRQGIQDRIFRTIGQGLKLALPVPDAPQ